MIHVQRRKKVTGLAFHENRKEIKTKKKNKNVVMS